MKKKKKTTLFTTHALVCALISICMLSGCGSADEPVTSTPEASTPVTALPEEPSSTVAESLADTENGNENTAPAEITELSEDLFDYQISINGTIYQLPMKFSDFETQGWTYKNKFNKTVPEELSGEENFFGFYTLNGIEAEIRVINFSPKTKPLGECALVSLIFDDYPQHPENTEINFAKGITFNKSGYEDIIAAYGTPTEEEQYEKNISLTYKNDSDSFIHFTVSKEENVLTYVHMYNPNELEPADLTLNLTIPNSIAAYTPPTSVSEDFSGHSIEFNGNLYTMPCPVSAFLENGLKLETNIGISSYDTLLPGDKGQGILVSKDEKETFVDLYNFEEYHTLAENCHVTSFTGYLGEDTMTIPYGINLGTKEEDLLDILMTYYNLAGDVIDQAGDTYYVEDPENDRNEYEITVEDGIVVYITVECYDEP